MNVAFLIMKQFRLLLSLLALSLLTAIPAYAQAVKWLTEDNIRSFIAESASVPQKSYDDYLAFIKKTTHEEYRGKIMMNITIPNSPPTQVPIDLDKDEVIKTAREGYDSSQGATTKQTIQEITISPDKKTATVKWTFTIINQKLPSEADMQSTLADSTSICIDEVVYTPMIGVQVIKSDYKTDVTIKQEQEL